MSQATDIKARFKGFITACRLDEDGVMEITIQTYGKPPESMPLNIVEFTLKEIKHEPATE